MSLKNKCRGIHKSTELKSFPFLLLHRSLTFHFLYLPDCICLMKFCTSHTWCGLYCTDSFYYTYVLFIGSVQTVNYGRFKSYDWVVVCFSFLNGKQHIQLFGTNKGNCPFKIAVFPWTLTVDAQRYHNVFYFILFRHFKSSIDNIIIRSLLHCCCIHYAYLAFWFNIWISRRKITFKTWKMVWHIEVDVNNVLVRERERFEHFKELY